MAPRTYELFAAVLTYPGPGYDAVVRECAASAPPECRDDMAVFAAGILHMSLEEAQEKFTAAFDLNPDCTLDLGWHLFGEKYERGLLLARIRRELQRRGIAESTNLPDHLSHVLLLLGRMEPGAAEDFAGAVVIPAVAKVVLGAQKHEPFNHLLRAIQLFLRTQYPEAVTAATQTLPVIQPPPSRENSRAMDASTRAAAAGHKGGKS